jgi:excisionase family DNA binding protein
VTLKLEKGTRNEGSNIGNNEGQSIFENSRAETKAASKAEAQPQGKHQPLKWLTTQEAADYLRVSISSIKTMIYRGQVRVHKLGRRNRFLFRSI